MEDSKTKRHVLIMDDTMESHTGQMLRMDMSEMFQNSGQDVDVVFASSPLHAQGQLHMWAELGIKPDIVSMDFLYGADDKLGPVEYARIASKLYKDKPELAPAKLFVHSKSGLREYSGPEYALANEVTANIGAEYCHAYEWLAIAQKYIRGEDEISLMRPTTTSLRQYLADNWGLKDLPEGTRDRSGKSGKRVLNKDQRYFLDDIGDRPIAAHDAARGVDIGAIEIDEALKRLDTDDLRSSCHARLTGEQDDHHPVDFARGTNGAASGVAAFSAEEVTRYKAEGKKVILVLEHFKPSDVSLLQNVDGVVVLGRGSSHLAMLCENFGITGIFSQQKHHWGVNTPATPPLSIQHDAQGYRLVSNPDNTIEKQTFTIESGQTFSIAANSYKHEGAEHRGGSLHRMKLEVEKPKIEDLWYLRDIMPWVYNARHVMTWHRRDNQECHGLSVRANADTYKQIETAIANGADGIGLVRTEHLLLSSDVLPHVQAYMLSEDDAEKKSALEKIREAQLNEFMGIFNGSIRTVEDYPTGETTNYSLPVTVRLFDAKPDEILTAGTPKADALIAENCRGAAWALKHPEFYAMQADALFEAASKASTLPPEVMIPMVRTGEELAAIKTIVDAAAAKHGFDGKYKFGAMIETRDAVAHAAAIAKQCDFLSFGTNDLSSEITGLKRNDIEGVDKWMRDHTQANPFRILTPEVKAAMSQVITAARTANPKIKLKLCGEHGQEQDTVAFCQSKDMDEVSVPPSLANLATTGVIAAQEALKAFEAVQAENTKFRDKISKLGQSRGYSAAV